MDESCHHGFGSTNWNNTDFDDQLLQFCTEAIEAANPEVLNRQFWSDYNNIILPISQDNQFITEFESVSCQFGMDSITSMDQQMVSDNQLHRNHVYESGRLNYRIPYFDQDISNINDDTAMEMNLSHNFETYNNIQVPPSGIEIMDTDQGLILNSDLEYGIHGLTMANGSGNRRVRNVIQMGNTVHDMNAEHNSINYRIIENNTEGLIESKREISRAIRQFVSPDSENGAMFYDFESKNCATNCVKFDNTRFEGIYNAVRNIENYDQEIQSFGNLRESRIGCGMAEYDPQHSLNLYKIPYVESIHSFQGNIRTLNNKEALKNVRNIKETRQFIGMENIGKNLASNIGISQNEDATSEYFYHGVSEKDGIPFTDDTFAFPGPSVSHEKITSNYFKSSSPTELLYVAQQNYWLTQYCMICKNNIDKHGIVCGGKEIYKCCSCDYRCNFMPYLRIHIFKHLYNTFCNICSEVIRHIDWHGIEHTCQVCHEAFRCKTLLETHLLNHNNYFSKLCRVCMKEISKHILQHPNLTLYKCCQCFYFGNLWRFQKHLHTHTGLRLFKCDECGNRFTQKPILNKHLKIHWRRKT